MKYGRKFLVAAVGLMAIGAAIAFFMPGTELPSGRASEEAIPPDRMSEPVATTAANPIQTESTVQSATAAGASLVPEASAQQIPPSMEPAWKKFASAEVVESREGRLDAEGLIERIRVVKADMKYPHVRIVEKVRASDPAGEPVSFTAAVADHMLVRVRDGLSEDKVATIAGQHGFSVRKKMLAPDTYLISFGDVSIDALPAALEAFNAEANAVRYAEPDYVVFAAATTPNDPAFGQLWGMHQRTDKDIDAPEAWDLGQGSSNVVVAVIDTGIDYGHEDLSANMWRNPGEIPGNGVDDDGNGFRDDVYGWDFCNEDSDPYDDNAHGTHCAGTIGAAGNNGIGVAGVVWRVNLMAIKALNQGGSGFISDAVDAVYYATQRGVRLSSSSWGYYGWVQSLKDAIDDAGTSNVLFVAAAGNEVNDDDTNPCYPASFVSANIISVAATDADDDLAWFSNYGKTAVDLGAPGVGIYSTVPTTQGKYAYMSGTSMSAPHVAGACALIAAYSPTLTAAQIKQRILDNTDRSSTLSGKTVTGGRLNLFKGLSGAVPLEPPAAPSALGATPYAAHVEVSWTDNATNETGFVLERRSGSSGFTALAALAADAINHTDTNVMGGVTYVYRVKATNAAGSSAYAPEASATVPGAADAWDPGDDASEGAILLSPITAVEASHGPHTLSGTDPYDWFKADLVAGNTYNFNAIGGSGDTYAELFLDAAGTQPVLADDDGGGGLMFMLEYVADTDATYYVRVRTEPAFGNAAYNVKYSLAESSNQMPLVSLTSPGSNAVYQAPASISMEALASDPDGSIAQVQFFAGATLLASDAAAPYAHTWGGVVAGNYVLQAVATDNDGASVASSPVSVVVNAQPLVNLIGPSNGAVFVEGTAISIQAAASDSDGTIAQVSFYDGETLLDTDISAPFGYSWPHAALGGHSLFAVATDNQGGNGMSGTTTVSVVVAQPVLTVDPTNVNVQVLAGQDAPAGAFTVANGGSGTLNYGVSEDIDWLSVSPTNGSSTGATNVHVVTYSTAGLAPGSYAGTITVAAAGATGSPKNIAVNLRVSSNSLDTGLLAYYPFNGNTDDESGNGHLIANYGAELGQDRRGNGNSAFSFDGLDDYMTVGDSAGNLNFDVRNESFTVAFWAQIRDLARDQETLVMDRASSTNDPCSYRLYILKERNVIVANCWDGGKAMHVPATTVLATGSWYHITMVADTSKVMLYINGLREMGPQIASNVSNELIPTNFGSTVNRQTARLFGKMMPNNSLHFKGSLDDVRFYGRALSADEVWQLYGAGRAAISGTIDYGGSQTGAIVVVAGNYTNQIAAPGAYAIDNLPTPGTYNVSAFRDSNGNNQRDADEPYGAYAGNPVYLTENLAGVDIVLTDRSSIDDGLVAYYPFNGNANDESGNGNHGVNSNAVLVSDRSGSADSAYFFNGTNAQVLVGDNPALRSLGSNYAFSVWARFASLPTHDVSFLIKSPAPGSTIKWIFWQHVQAAPLGLGVALRRTTGGADQQWACNYPASTSAWHMLTFSSSGTNGFFAVDGVVQSVQAGNMALPDTTGMALAIGGIEPGGHTWFHGLLDDVRIYNRTLSSNEVWELYGGSATASIGGTVQYAGEQTGPIVVRAGIYGTTLAGPGAYAISNLPAGTYSVSAFCDVNGNGTLDDCEPVQNYSGNPVAVSAGNVAGVDIAIGDPDSDGDGLSDAYEAGFGRYRIVEEPFTWSEAMTNAVVRGGHLATITSATEWQAIQQVVGQYARGLDLWLGATDEQQEGVWKWITGEPWSYTRWHPGEPNNNGNEDFLEINHPTNTTGLWNDYRDIPGDPLGYLLEIGYYTDPRNADTDADGLDDGLEVNVHQTVPTNPDSDGDGLNDGAEIAAGTDPLDPDSDDDGLNDHYEVVVRPCLNPENPDTDGDGVSDGQEVASGSDPCSAGSGLFSIAGTVSYGGDRTGQIVVVAADQAMPADGLVAYYPFNGNANDESGHGRTGTVNGATWVADGARGGAYRFDADTQNITATDAGLPSGDAPRSLAMWLKIDREYSNGCTGMFGYGTDNFSRQFSGLGFDWRLDRDRLYFSPGGACFLTARKLPAPGTWVHVAYTYGGNGAHHLYFDGVPSDGMSELWGPVSTLLSGILRIGGIPGGTGPEGGYVDEVRIYDRVLSSNEVAQIYQGRQYSAVLAGPGPYLISDMVGGTEYAVTAFMDCDGNGVLDDGEPRGSHAANPVPVTGPVTGVDIELTVPATGWTMRATHALAEYDSPGTATVDCEVYFPTNRNLLALGWTVSLPQGWALTAAAGDGGALANPTSGEILFSSVKLTNNPIRFTYDVGVPAGQSGPQAIAGTVVYTMSGAETNDVRMASPDPLVVNAASAYHSSDYRNPKWVIDLPECNRTLSYWRSGGYGVRPGTVDGYAPNETSRDGDRHSADYREPFWQLDGEEALRVVGYWTAGGYHVDAGGADGYAPGITTNGSFGIMDVGDISALAVAPSTYVPGHEITLRGTLSYAHDIIGLLWKPHLPAGWTILSVRANGGTPEVVNNEILFTTKLPPSPLEIVYVCNVPGEMSGDALVQTDVQLMRQGTANPQSLFGMMAPNMLQLDTDGDGLPDWIETNTGAYRSPTDTGTDPNNPDTDGDGVLDGDEVPAGTNPNQAGDAFKILSLAPKTGDYIMAVGTPFEVKWSSVAGKTYSVFRTTNLLLGFDIIRSNVLATPPVNTFIDTLPPDPQASYSVGVE